MTRKDQAHATRSAFVEIGMLIDSIMIWNGRSHRTAAQQRSALDMTVLRSIANANLPLFTDDVERADGLAP